MKPYAFQFILLLILFPFGSQVTAQVTDPEIQKVHDRRSLEHERRGMAESYKGITNKGKIEEGIFELKSTGVTTEPVRNAATNFLNSLDENQQNNAKFSVDDDEWRKWMNVNFYVREGVGFYEMTEKQRSAAFDLMSASLSVKGLKLSKDIMKLNHTLGEINNNFQEFGEWLYWITIMGEPSETEPWGWQLDGHHLVINYFVLGDQVVMTPLFVGSEPVIAETGKYKGIEILQDEQDSGLEMLRSLDGEQRSEAILEKSKNGGNNLTEFFKDNVDIDYKGVKVSSFTNEQKDQFRSLVKLYVDNMDEGHAKIKMDEVEKYLDDTWFSWIGGFEDDSVYYYRIHSPVILIEFDHRNPIATKHLYGGAVHKQHVHVVVRTPNGNDYGKDLLKQHYKEHPHD